MSASLGLYIHLPFCHKICPYCSFYKHTPGGTDFTRFINALLAEARFHAERLNHPSIRTVYLGGGTPSLLSEKHLTHLFTGLGEIFDLSHVLEIDLEANPMTFGLSKAQLFRELGVTRVSLGIQSFQPDELQALGRDHTPEQAAESFQLLREANIPSCNLDLMFSVPHQTVGSWADTLDQALALKPDHISCYNLTYEEDTPYFDSFTKGELIDDPDLNANLFTLAHEKITTAKFNHYETSNYARSAEHQLRKNSNRDHRSLHNISYWQGLPYLGLGPSAVSTLPSKSSAHHSTRHRNTPDTPKYLSQIEITGHAMTEIEHLTDEQWQLERLALLLRTNTGLPLNYLPKNAHANSLIQQNLATLTPTHLILTPEGSLHVDTIAAQLA
ncbi:MAG: radical SAM family heme chaperone HemW [Verrucomicrobiota bacterium]